MRHCGASGKKGKDAWMQWMLGELTIAFPHLGSTASDSLASPTMDRGRELKGNTTGGWGEAGKGAWDAMHAMVAGMGPATRTQAGGLVWAARSTKWHGEKPRSERGKRESWRRVASSVSRAGEGHPPRWFSAGREEVATARGSGCWCWIGSGETPEVWRG